MKKILINGRFFTQQITGVQRYAREVLTSLEEILKDEKYSNLEIILLIPRQAKIDQAFEKITVKRIGLGNGHFWEQVFLPIYSFRKLLLGLCNTGPIFKKKQVIVIHDTAVFANPDNFSFQFRIYYKILFKFISKLSLKLITVSEFSKREIMKYLRVPADKIIRIYEGHEHILRLPADPNTLRKFGLVNKKYFLAASSLNRNKNMKGLIQAFHTPELSEFTLALAGSKNSKVFENEEFPEIPNAKFLGYVSDRELRSLYENALAFVFPSFYEGFGLPVLEAIACGCPVITSENSSMVEIAGGLAEYCDPLSPRSIRKSILAIISANNFTIQRQHKPKVNITKEFHWKYVSKKLIEALT